MKQQWTIHRCLAELKTLEKRISKDISKIRLIDYKKNSSEKSYETKLTEKDFKEQAKASFDSIMKLISNRNKIKNAIVLSNATTTVKIGNKKYTVAEAIQRKESIMYDRMLLESLKEQYKESNRIVNSNNQKAEEKAEQQVAAILGSDTKAEEKILTMKNIIENNSWTLLDPIRILEVITFLENTIDSFETEVDHNLSVSNATTVIEIDLDN